MAITVWCDGVADSTAQSPIARSALNTASDLSLISQNICDKDLVNSIQFNKTYTQTVKLLRWVFGDLKSKAYTLKVKTSAMSAC